MKLTKTDLRFMRDAALMAHNQMLLAAEAETTKKGCAIHVAKARKFGKLFYKARMALAALAKAKGEA